MLIAAIVMAAYGSAEELVGDKDKYAQKRGWVADQGDGTYVNPVIFADYSDPDVIRVGEDFYMVSSSFNCTPGIPVLHSRNLVSWSIIGHVFQNLPSPMFDVPQHGKGCWAPSIRFHDGEFYVYYGDPDLGIFMSKARRPTGPWEPLTLVRAAKGWIDPCPFWDDDGNAYLVHAWAKSRAGFNSVLTVHRMSWDGKSILDEGTLVFDGTARHPTIEGPKIYKRNGYYYIFAPAGGVKGGWQTVLRSGNVFGPCEDRIVLAQGSTEVNGPHQGGWVETTSGESWFLHFQDRGAYGRIVHLQPMLWKNDWPVIGVDEDGDGVGEPVPRWKKPNVGRSYPMMVPQTNDEFESSTLGLQWQWHANHKKEWYSLTAKPGALRLFAIASPESSATLWETSNLLLQKLSAPSCTVTTRLDFHPVEQGEMSGLVVMGLDYSFAALSESAEGMQLVHVVRKEAEDGAKEHQELAMPYEGGPVSLRVTVDSGAVCRFSFSRDGQTFQPFGGEFRARQGVWIGAKVGIFCKGKQRAPRKGYSDFDWVRVE